MLRLDESNNRPLCFQIDDMRLDDLDEIVEIEETSGLSRWGYEAYLKEIVRGDAEGRILLVARPVESPVRTPTVLGFLCSLVVADEWHINNLATHPEFRRQGIGSSLIREGIARARARGAVCGFLEVRASNYSARAFYRALGFTVWHRRPNYYSDPVEDALIMRLELT
ncbi:MAG TPA: ribosomal protein S18-alanine N-acetyltransferase [Blastocatellia bacterium]|nr:ribosomal protein S18-alanine N-acetyltransferase [Blastocatellia bacterium]